MRFLFLILFLLISWNAQAKPLLNVQEVVSPSGIKAWLVQDDKLPLIAVHFAFKGGVEQDGETKQGLSAFLAEALTQGAGPYDAEAFQDILANQSIELGFSAGRDAFSGSMKALSEDRAQAFTLLRLALTEPRFEAEAVERVRRQMQTARRFQLGQEDWQARVALFNHLFAGHPYRFQRLGTKDSLASIQEADLRDVVKKRFARDNLLISVAGNIGREELAHRLDEVFGTLPLKAELEKIEEVKGPQGPALIHLPREGTQTQFLFTLPAPRRDDPDYDAAVVLNYVLGGGGFTSRLMKKIRDEEGLTYGIGTGISTMDHAALFMGNASADNDKVAKAWDMTRDILKAMRAEGITAEELRGAQAYLTGSLPLSLTSTGAIASVLLGLQQEGLGADYLDRYPALIGAVTLEDVRRVAERFLDLERLVGVMIGSPLGVQPSSVQEQVQE